MSKVSNLFSVIYDILPESKSMTSREVKASLAKRGMPRDTRQVTSALTHLKTKGCARAVKRHTKDDLGIRQRWLKGTVAYKYTRSRRILVPENNWSTAALTKHWPRKTFIEGKFKVKNTILVNEEWQ